MRMGFIVHEDLVQGQRQREVTIPKKKWIKDYFSFIGNFFILRSNGETKKNMEDSLLLDLHFQSHSLHD